MKPKIKMKLLIISLIIIFNIIILSIILLMLNKNSRLTFEKMKRMPQEKIISILENITDKELIELSYHKEETLTNDLHKFDDFSVKLIQGEKWGEYNCYFGSFSSLEEAKEVALKYLGKNKEIEFIGENDIYYQFRIKKENSLIREIFYKDSVIKFSKDSLLDKNDKYGYYIRNAVFQKLDYNTVLTIMDLENSDGLYRYFKENHDEYIYTKYTIIVVYGDWGLNNRVLLKKHISKISKSTGKIEIDEYIIKDDVEIPNSRPEEPEPPDYNQAMNELKRYNINEVINELIK